MLRLIAVIGACVALFILVALLEQTEGRGDGVSTAEREDQESAVKIESGLAQASDPRVTRHEGQHEPENGAIDPSSELRAHPDFLSQFARSLEEAREGSGISSQVPRGMREWASEQVLAFLDANLPIEAEFVRINGLEGLGVQGQAQHIMLAATIEEAGGSPASYARIRSDGTLQEKYRLDPMLAPVEWSVFDARGDMSPIRDETLFSLRQLQWEYLKRRATVLAELRIVRTSIQQTASDLVGDSLLSLDLSQEWLPHEVVAAREAYLQLGPEYNAAMERKLAELGYR